jgi:Zn-dependent protease with chaperone function
MRKRIREIYHAFAGKLIGRKIMKHHVCEVLSLMDDEIIDFISSNCWFCSSMDDAWAFTLLGNELRGQHIVLLSDELLMQTSDQIRYTIAHEIGHIILGHRNSILGTQTKAEIRKQEKEADAFAKKYLET